MTQYIDKAAVKAEIEKRRSEWLYGSSIEAKYKREECDDILSFLNTLEVKGVDFEREIEKYLLTNATFLIGGNSKLVVHHIAKYFFELGLKTKGGKE